MSVGGYNPGDRVGTRGVVAQPNENYDKLVLVDTNNNSQKDAGEEHLRVKIEKDSMQFSNLAKSAGAGAFEGAFVGLNAGFGVLLGAAVGKKVGGLGIKGGMILGGVALGAVALGIAEKTSTLKGGDKVNGVIFGGIFGSVANGIAGSLSFSENLGAEALNSSPAGIVMATTLVGGIIGAGINTLSSSKVFQGSGIPNTVAPKN